MLISAGCAVVPVESLFSQRAINGSDFVRAQGLPWASVAREVGIGEGTARRAALVTKGGALKMRGYERTSKSKLRRKSWGMPWLHRRAPGENTPSETFVSRSETAVVQEIAVSSNRRSLSAAFAATARGVFY